MASDRLAQSNFSRLLGTTRVRRREALAAGASGLAWLLAACSTIRTSPAGDASSAGVPSPQPPLAAPTPSRGGVLRAGNTYDLLLTSGAPLLPNAFNYFVVYPVLEELVRYRTALEPELVLVDEFDYSTDRTRLVARLKQDLRFHNGAPVTPEDVFFCVDLAANPAKYGVGASNIVSFAQAIVEMKAVDKRTMEFRFDKPHVNMTDFFAQLQITPAATHDKLRAGTDIQGTGPYRFVKWTPKQSIRLEANPNWHLKNTEGGPFLDAIDVTIFADNDAMGLAFESGALDLILGAPPDLAARYKGSSQLFIAPKIGVYYLGVVVDNPLLADPRVRQALFLALDRKRFVEEVQEGLAGSITAQTWPPTSPAFDPALEAAFYDPKRASALLNEAGFRQSQPLTLDIFPQISNYGQIVQQNLHDVGVAVELHEQDSATFNQRFLDRKFTGLFITAQSYSNLTPVTTLQTAFVYQIPNPMHYQSSEYSDVLARLSALDPGAAEAKAQYQRFNKLFVEDPWLLPLHASVRQDLTSKSVQGFGEYFIMQSWEPNFGKIAKTG